MAKRRTRGDSEEAELGLEIAPMLDVTFLLLIFFLCIIKFKTLEGRLDAYLPKDMGSARTQSEVLENIDVKIVPGENESIVYVNRKAVEKIPNFEDAPTDEVTLPTLATTIGTLHSQLPDRTCVIDPKAGVVHGHVVAVLNTIMAQKLKKVIFTMPATR